MTQIIRARAPLRISFAGGGTDVRPYSDERGGLVLNATINRYAYVTLVPRDDGRVTLRSLDYGNETAYDAAAGVPPMDGTMDLAKGVVHRLGTGPRGFDLYTHTDCPPGSGLGASSTLVVAMVSAVNAWLRLGIDRYEVARLAYEIEREDLGIEGGRQDQYAAAFGGFNFMEFHGDVALVNPLRIPPEWVGELEYSLVLAYTGTSRVSSEIIASQIANYRSGSADPVEAMDRSKQFAIDLKRVLLTGKFRQFGEMLHEAWLEKKRMSEKISNPQIDHLYATAREAGALGGKVSGAGGGGFMFFFTSFDRRQQVAAALRAQGADIVDFGFTEMGAQTWTL